MGRKLVTSLSLLATLALGLTGCAGMKPSPVDPRYMGYGGPGDQMTTRIGGDSGLFSFGRGKNSAQSNGGGAGIGVNAYLWRGALDTLSFLPLVSADPFGGVIITDWYSPADAQNERFKATAYILGRDLRSDGIRISVFRQVDQGGHWVDAPVSQVTQEELENKVLERARRLREQATGQG
jgi:Domain of unknown function (DUF3576)